MRSFVFILGGGLRSSGQSEYVVDARLSWVGARLPRTSHAMEGLFGIVAYAHQGSGFEVRIGLQAGGHQLQ